MTDFRTLPAGPELDVLIAARVLGWTNCHVALSNAHGIPPEFADKQPPDHTINFPGLAWSRVISSAWEIVGVMERRGWLLTLIRRTSVTEHPNGVDWRAVFWRPSPDGLEIEESADTAPLAICRAALAALEVGNDA